MFVEDRKMGLWCQVINLSAYFLGIPEVFCHTPALLKKSLFIKDLWMSEKIRNI